MTKDYKYSRLEKIIDLENDLEELSRKSWKDKINYKIHPEFDETLYLIDDKLKRIIFLDGITQQSPNQLTVSRQIRNWLCGGTIKKQLDDGQKDIDKRDFKAFFQGNLHQIKLHNELLKVPTDPDPSIAWKILYYPIKYLDKKFAEDLINPVAKKEKDCSDYSYWAVYGIVSRDSFIRTNKPKILNVCKKFLGDRGFDIAHEIEGNDQTRNSEPIKVWVAKKSFGQSEFKAAVGVNFGYDNGLSSFRWGTGLYIPKYKLRLPNISRTLFRGNIESYEDDVKKVLREGNRRWIHHKSWGQLEKNLSEYLSNSFDIYFNKVGEILDKNKSRKYHSKESSKRILLGTHKSEFNAFQEPLEKSHDKFSKHYGPSAFTHFLTWLDIAGSGDLDLNRKAQAEFIACCKLGSQ